MGTTSKRNIRLLAIAIFVFAVFAANGNVLAATSVTLTADDGGQCYQDSTCTSPVLTVTNYGFGESGQWIEGKQGCIWTSTDGTCSDDSDVKCPETGALCDPPCNDDHPCSTCGLQLKASGLPDDATYSWYSTETGGPFQGVVYWTPVLGDCQQDYTVTIELIDSEGVVVVTQSVVIDVECAEPQTYSCVGFEAPMDKESVKVRQNKALPLKAQLLDAAGNPLTASDITALPVLQVTYDSGGGSAEDAEDVTDAAYPAGMGTDGNQFEYDDDGRRWQFNLKTKNYTAPGEYTITMVSGDETEYHVIDESCKAIFMIEE